MDYQQLLREHPIPGLSYAQRTAVVNALHAAYSAGHVTGYSAAISTQHHPIGL